MVSGLLLSIDFNVAFSGIYGSVFSAGTSSATYQHFNPPFEAVDPIPAKNRGLYFDAGTHLRGNFAFSHTFTIGIWVYGISGDILGDLNGRLKVSSPGTITLTLEN